MNELRRIGFHNFNSCTQAVRHIHHIHECTLLDRAYELFAFGCRVIDIDSIVGRTTTRRCYIGDKPRKTYGTSVDTETDVVVVTQQLSWNLRNTVHSTRVTDRVLRSLVLRSVIAEHADWTRSKYRTMHFTGNFQYIKQTAHTDFPGKLRFCFCHSRQQSCQIINSIYIIFRHSFSNLLFVCNVDNCRRPWFQQFAFRLLSGDVTCYNVSTVDTSQLHG